MGSYAKDKTKQKDQLASGWHDGAGDQQTPEMPTAAPTPSPLHTDIASQGWWRTDGQLTAPDSQ